MDCCTTEELGCAHTCATWFDPQMMTSWGPTWMQFKILQNMSLPLGGSDSARRHRKCCILRCRANMDGGDYDVQCLDGKEAPHFGTRQTSISSWSSQKLWWSPQSRILRRTLDPLIRTRISAGYPPGWPHFSTESELFVNERQLPPFDVTAVVVGISQFLVIGSGSV